MFSFGYPVARILPKGMGSTRRLESVGGAGSLTRSREKGRGEVSPTARSCPAGLTLTLPKKARNGRLDAIGVCPEMDGSSAFQQLNTHIIWTAHEGDLDAGANGSRLYREFGAPLFKLRIGSVEVIDSQTEMV